jgi:hypothetical protein
VGLRGVWRFRTHTVCIPTAKAPHPLATRSWAQLKNYDSDGISPCTDGEDEAAQDSESAYLADDQMYQETTEMADPRETYNPEVEWRLPMENAGHVE